MLSAYDDKGQLICLVDGLPVKSCRYRCPACEQEVILKKGSRYRSHFAHKSLQHCLFHQENESFEHLTLKATLYKALSRTEEVQIECPIKELKQVADLLVNQRLVLEVQCSPLPKERLAERTNSYRQAGYVVRWLLGKKLWLNTRLTQLQRDFLYFSQNMGFHLWELDLEKEELRLKYLIHEDLEGKVHFLSQSFSLTDLTLKTFRFPFQKQPLTSLRVQQNPALLTYIQKQLFYKSVYWLKAQEEAYQQGQNLLTRPLQAYYPQVQLPARQQGFLQVDKDLTTYYHQFKAFYQGQSDKTYQILYPPAYLQLWHQKKRNPEYYAD